MKGKEKRGQAAAAAAAITVQTCCRCDKVTACMQTSKQPKLGRPFAKGGEGMRGGEDLIPIAIWCILTRTRSRCWTRASSRRFQND